MASSTPKSLSGTPLRNHENLTKICREMKSWIFHSPHALDIDISPDSPCSISTVAGNAADESCGESPDQNSANAGGPCSPQPEAKDVTNSSSNQSELHEGPENTFTKDSPAPGKADVVLASTTISETNASQMSVILEAAEHNPKSISAPLSAAKSSSSGPLEDLMSKPLGVIQAAIPCPIGLETKACLGDKDWSISSNCSSDHAYKKIIFGPGFSQTSRNRSDSGNADCVTRQGICDDWGEDVVSHSHDPVNSWLVKHLTSPCLLVPPDGISDPVNSRCDIDPEKGEFLPPVLQPETLRCTMEGPCEDYHDILWRQNNMTAELYVMKELRSRENIATTLRMALDHEANRPELSSESGQAWPKANCIVRPATQLDLPAIVEIINEHHKRAMKPQGDKRPVMHVEDMARVWDKCRADNRPFIVVAPVQEDFLDRSKWPNHSEAVYEEFTRFMAKKPRSALTVVGFAFIENSQLGLNDCACSRASYSGRLNLMVHSDHRRRLYGSALLDRILISISPLHASVVDHDWNRNMNEFDGIYEFPASRNVRQYTILHVEVLEPHDTVETPEPSTHFLKKFGFEPVGRLENVLVTEVDQRMHWQDLVTWARGITPTSNVIGGW
ncbi:hypothetical protein E4U43_007649 [Claviceps pusilla]|uniref:Uncharacterized protein n=1 Tax=Claviceps pusilla TaxID=123648 RepID=A0A9P7NC46_9HYPO|nr:hypothetical protein E4U43_007649 [Claviceps pusilla]